MGRATEFYHFINQKELDKEEEKLYTHLTITDDINKFRKDHLISKKSGLKAAGDGTFSLF